MYKLALACLVGVASAWRHRQYSPYSSGYTAPYSGQAHVARGNSYGAVRGSGSRGNSYGGIRTKGSSHAAQFGGRGYTAPFGGQAHVARGNSYGAIRSGSRGNSYGGIRSQNTGHAA